MSSHTGSKPEELARSAPGPALTINMTVGTESNLPGIAFIGQPGFPDQRLRQLSLPQQLYKRGEDRYTAAAQNSMF